MEDKLIRIKNKTKQQLDQLGKKNQSYNNIIENLIKFFQKNK